MIPIQSLSIRISLNFVTRNSGLKGSFLVLRNYIKNLANDWFIQCSLLSNFAQSYSCLQNGGQEKRRVAAAIDFKSLELADMLHFENKVKEKEKLGGGVQFYDVESVSDPVVVDGVLKRKVKYVGNGRKHDEWLPVSDIRSKTEGDIASSSSLVLADLGKLKLRIKENLSLT